MKRALVVGSGISGLLAALMLKRSFGEVWLVERAEACGGLLRTWTSPEGIAFDYGTHIIRETGIEGIDRMLLDGVTERDWHVLPVLKAGNYFGGRLNETSPFIDASTLPEAGHRRGVEELLQAARRATRLGAEPANQMEQLERYFGPTLAREIFVPVLRKLYGCEPEALHPDAHRLFGLTRVVALDPDTSRELKKDPLLDARLAFHSFLEGRSGFRHFYPKSGGIGRWVELLEAKLRAAGVKILTRAQVEGVQCRDRTVRSVTLGGKQVACDLVVWTIPAAIFLHAAGAPGASRPPALRKTTLYHYVFDAPFRTGLHYFSCYDPAMASFRVTLYPNIGRDEPAPMRPPYRCTVEVLSGGETEPAGIAAALPGELQRMGVLPPSAKVLHSHQDAVPAGFPVYTHGFVDQSAQLAATVRERYANVLFLGKSQGGSFFMADVLRDTWNALEAMRA